MKSTGVVRKIDKLGRIVIPKEIRRNLNIRDEDSLEIFIEDENIILRKYSFVNKLNKITEKIANIVENIISKNVIITDMDRIISCNKKISNVFLNSEISNKYLSLIERRDNFISNSLSEIEPIKGQPMRCYYMLSPIVVNGDLVGSVLIYSDNSEMIEIDKLIMKFIINFLVKNLED